MGLDIIDSVTQACWLSHEWLHVYVASDLQYDVGSSEPLVPVLNLAEVTTLG